MTVVVGELLLTNYRGQYMLIFSYVAAFSHQAEIDLLGIFLGQFCLARLPEYMRYGHVMQDCTYKNWTRCISIFSGGPWGCINSVAHHNQDHKKGKHYFWLDIY